MITVTVEGHVNTPTGDPAVGQVIFAMPSSLFDVDSNLVFSKTSFRAVLDEDGDFSVVLPATDDPDITPATWTYEVDIALAGNQHTRGALSVLAANAGGGQEFLDEFQPGVTASVAGVYLEVAGGTMTGFLTLSADPISDLHAVTKQYVDAAVAALDARVEALEEA